MQLVTLNHQLGEVAFGANMPSQESIRCREYHWEMPSSFAIMSATLLPMPLIWPVMSDVTLWNTSSNQPRRPLDVLVGWVPEVVGVGIRLWPSMDTLS